MKAVVVFDTNILISGYLWKGKPRDAIEVAKKCKLKLLYCKESIAELVRVLSVKFRFDAQEIYTIVSDLKANGKEISVVSQSCPVKEDPTDNLFVNMALDGRADIIVSGDSHLLKLKQHEQIEIIRVNEFVARYSYNCYARSTLNEVSGP